MQINSISRTNFNARLSNEVKSQIKEAALMAYEEFPEEDKQPLLDDIKTIRDAFPNGTIYYRGKYNMGNYRGVHVCYPEYTLVLSRPGRRDKPLLLFPDPSRKNISIPDIHTIAKRLNEIQDEDVSRYASSSRLDYEYQISKLLK